MTASRGGQIIRASAGSLVRKLSLASIHSPFAHRSRSLSTANQRRATETLFDIKVEPGINPPKYSIVNETKALNEEQEDWAMTEEQIGGIEGRSPAGETLLDGS